MYALEHYELTRRKHFVDGMSQRAIAGELGHSRKFVKKALQHPIPPGYQPHQAQAEANAGSGRASDRRLAGRGPEATGEAASHGVAIL